jgi:hypothetical protein
MGSMPETVEKDGLRVQLDQWQYGEVAEILHVGAYSEEAPTVEKLRQFAFKRGYRMAGPHEEEYLKGPGMFFKGNPGKYMTIIRWRVQKDSL